VSDNRRIQERGWTLSLYPEAGEASGVWRSGGAGGWGGGRFGRASQEAGRRARGHVRRYCAANRLNRLGTVTYAGTGCHEPAELHADLAVFFRRVRVELGEQAIPYLWVREPHPGGHGLHAHFAVGRYVPRRMIEDAWGRGFVHIKLISNLPVGSGTLGESRRVGFYVAKYLTKASDGDRSLGRHRYEVAQGFQPRKVVLRARTETELLARASEVMGAHPAYVWRSDNEKEWDAPPACWACWD
jgi:hypothetical protein